MAYIDGECQRKHFDEVEQVQRRITVCEHLMMMMRYWNDDDDDDDGGGGGGVVLGTGMMHMRLIQRLVCGVWSPMSVEFIRPSLYVSVYTLTRNHHPSLE